MFQIVEEVTEKKVFMPLFNELIAPLYQDISALFSEGVPFLVDGDGLLIMAMGDALWKSPFQGSSVHLIYIIENYLDLFVERGGVFHIVFFDSWFKVWQVSSIHLLYREILIQHFLNNTKYHVHLIQNCFDQTLKKLISTVKPQFMLLNFDTRYHLETEDENVQENARILNCTNILFCLSIGLPCANCDYLTVDVFNVYAFYADTSGAVVKIVDFFKEKMKKFVSFVPKRNVLKHCPISFENLSIRLISAIMAAENYCKIEAIKSETEEAMKFLKLLLLNAAVLDSVQFENRACLKMQNCDDIKYLSFWYRSLSDALISLKTMECNWESVSDLWQGLLFAHLCCFLSKRTIKDKNQLGKTISSKYEKMLSVLNNIGIKLKPYPISSSFLNITWKYNCEKLNDYSGKLYKMLKITLRYM